MAKLVHAMLLLKAILLTELALDMVLELVLECHRLATAIGCVRVDVLEVGDVLAAAVVGVVVVVVVGESGGVGWLLGCGWWVIAI